MPLLVPPMARRVLHMLPLSLLLLLLIGLLLAPQGKVLLFTRLLHADNRAAKVGRIAQYLAVHHLPMRIGGRPLGDA